ncbi:MAG: phosphatase PAP2 family protein [Chthoniobacterales bacterium]
MPDLDRHALRIDPAGLGGPGAPPFCNQNYKLQGPQVEPGASYFMHCIGDKLRIISEDELNSRVSADPYPADADTQKIELEELIQLARLRDEPGMIGHFPIGPEKEEPQRDRLPLSLFLQLRPQPIGAAINTARGQSFPVVSTGRELARYFENETPGLAHQLALDYIFRETPIYSPPRQALIWAALHVAIASALSAAWYFKWRGPAGVKYRPRPRECFPKLDVLYDRVPNSTNSADGPRRGFPFDVRPMDAKAGEQEKPESQVPDIIPLLGSAKDPNWTGYPTPGTPRHPAYPSGHSTYSAAASRLLARFFPMWREELDKLADNIGLARLWAGIHWRTDHTFGQKVGNAVADWVIDQLVATKIFKLNSSGNIALPDPAPTDPNTVPNPCPSSTSVSSAGIKRNRTKTK